jgi:hypothetical protein
MEFVDQVAERAAIHLEPGEVVVTAIPAQLPKRTDAADAAALGAKPGSPLVVALTDRRLLLWRSSALPGPPVRGQPLGEEPLESISAIETAKGPSDPILVIFENGTQLELEPRRGGSARSIAIAFRRMQSGQPLVG